MDPQDLAKNNQDPTNNDEELSVQELESVAGGGGGDLPQDSDTINNSDCNGNCGC